MRDTINVFYYPEMTANRTTLKKAILFFDEIHFIDRPSFNFGGKFGLIGTTSPLRQFERSFRDAGVPLFVHGAPGGPVRNAFYEQIAADVNSPRGYWKVTQEGKRWVPSFIENGVAPRFLEVHFSQWESEQRRVAGCYVRVTNVPAAKVARGERDAHQHGAEEVVATVAPAVVEETTSVENSIEFKPFDSLLTLFENYMASVVSQR